MAKKYVSWRRVSTHKQSKSGLGLQAQKEIIRYFVERDGGEWIADYEECYTGTELSGCVELRKAMAHAKNEDAILIIAKSDRFRNTAEALKIYEEMGDGRIMFCDLPTTDKFTLTLFFALAEREALIVSIRTKQALDAKRARGEKTGGASDKWIETYKNKSKEQKEIENMKRGVTKNDRYLAKRDTQVFFKILKNVFSDVLVGDDPTQWDWSLINTKGDNKDNILRLMHDYRDMDDTHTLFRKWDFDMDTTKLQIRLCAHIQNVRNAIKNHKRLSKENY